MLSCWHRGNRWEVWRKPLRTCTYWMCNEVIYLLSSLFMVFLLRSFSFPLWITMCYCVFGLISYYTHCMSKHPIFIIIIIAFYSLVPPFFRYIATPLSKWSYSCFQCIYIYTYFKFGSNDVSIWYIHNLSQWLLLLACYWHAIIFLYLPRYGTYSRKSNLGC